jgi:hypothetical protein
VSIRLFIPSIPGSSKTHQRKREGEEKGPGMPHPKSLRPFAFFFAAFWRASSVTFLNAGFLLMIDSGHKAQFKTTPCMNLQVDVLGEEIIKTFQYLPRYSRGSTVL